MIWDATFPFWEVAIAVFATGLVTFFTIWASVRTARQETTRQLAQDAANRANEAARRAQETEARLLQESRSLRIRLGEAMTRTVHELQLTRKLKASDPSQISARAMWAALRVQLEASGEKNSKELYELVDLLVEQADAPLANLAEEGKFDFLVAAVKANFSRGSTAHIAHWVSNPEISPSFHDALQQARQWKSARDREVAEQIDEFMRDFIERKDR